VVVAERASVKDLDHAVDSDERASEGVSLAETYDQLVGRAWGGHAARHIPRLLVALEQVQRVRDHPRLRVRLPVQTPANYLSGRAAGWYDSY
jgi:hypothetical protein